MKVIKYFINAIISCILLFLIILLIFITCNKTIISKKNISNFISNANVMNFDVNMLFNQEQSGVTLKEKIFSLAVDNYIPTKIINDIMESEEINKLLGDFFNQTIKYTITGGTKPKILDETIYDMKKIANQSLNRHMNIMIEEKELDIYIENYCNSITNIVPDRQLMIGNLPIPILENIISFNVLYLYIIIILILILVSLINKCWYKFIKYLGIIMLTSGIIFVIIGSMEYIITNFILNNINTMQAFIKPLITNILTIWFKAGVLVSFISIVFILIYITINRISNN